jgi:hypothetical protein
MASMTSPEQLRVLFGQGKAQCFLLREAGVHRPPTQVRAAAAVVWTMQLQGSLNGVGYSSIMYFNVYDHSFVDKKDHNKCLIALLVLRWSG